MKSNNHGLIARARKVLAMDFQESNDFVHGTVRDLIKALGGDPDAKVKQRTSEAPASILAQALEADRKMNGTPTVARDLSNRTSIGDIEVRGDCGTFKIKDIFRSVNRQALTIRADVGYASIDKVAAVIMDQLNLRFNVKTINSYEADAGRGLFVEFEPAITDARWEEFRTFLGQKTP